MGWLPRFGGEAQAAPELLQLARGVATAGRASMDGAYLMAQALDGDAGESSMLARLVPALAQSQPNWQEAEAALIDVAAARSRLEQVELDPMVAGQLERLDRYLPLLQTGSAMAQVAPALLGADGPKAYLLLAQNNEELRPTGGFISGVGVLEVDRGMLGEVDFADSYTVYNPEVDHPLAPPDLEQAMGAQMLLFRDANWSTDFPSNANVLQSLYQLDMGAATDGVIAFDLEAVRRLMIALEPMTLPGYEQPVTAENVLTVMREMWEEPAEAEGTIAEAYSSDWWLNRKDFMGDLAMAARAKLEAGEVDFGKLAQALYGSLLEKHLLVAVNDQATAALLTEAGWSGAVDPGEGDYLFVVDTNVGWNKVNSVVKRDTRYTIAPRADGSAVVDLELVYHHQGEANDELCVHVSSPYGESYEEMTRRCYFNYIRILAPAGVELLNAEGFESGSVSVRSGERATTQLAGRLVVPSGSARRVRLSYALPAGLIDGGTYNLRVQKQPGTPAWPVEVVMVDPEGVWQATTPDGQRSDQGLQLSFTLSSDTDVSLAQRP